MIKFIFCFFILFTNQFAYCQYVYDIDGDKKIDTCIADFSEINKLLSWSFFINGKEHTIEMEKHYGYTSPY